MKTREELISELLEIAERETDGQQEIVAAILFVLCGATQVHAEDKLLDYIVAGITQARSAGFSMN